MTYSPEQYEAWEKVREAGRRQLAVSKYWKLIMADLRAAAKSGNDGLEKLLSECLDPISDLLTREMRAHIDANIAFESLGDKPA